MTSVILRTFEKLDVSKYMKYMPLERFLASKDTPYIPGSRLLSTKVCTFRSNMSNTSTVFQVASDWEPTIKHCIY